MNAGGPLGHPLVALDRAVLLVQVRDGGELLPVPLQAMVELDQAGLPTQEFVLSPNLSLVR